MTEVVGLAISTFKGVYKAFVFIEEYRGADAQVIEAKGQFQETDRLLHAVRSRRIDLWCEGTDNDVLTEVQVVERRTWHELAHFDNTILKRMDHSKSRFPAYRKVRNKISWVRHMEATSRELLILLRYCCTALREVDTRMTVVRSMRMVRAPPREVVDSEFMEACKILGYAAVDDTDDELSAQLDRAHLGSPAYSQEGKKSGRSQGSD